MARAQPHDIDHPVLQYSQVRKWSVNSGTSSTADTAHRDRPDRTIVITAIGAS
jgi:hypothetical protein